MFEVVVSTSKSGYSIPRSDTHDNHHLYTVKLPFPLTYGFKFMLQRDINTPNMDVRYVSALSWYFLNLFGLNGVFKLILGQENSMSKVVS